MTLPTIFHSLCLAPERQPLASPRDQLEQSHRLPLLVPTSSLPLTPHTLPSLPFCSLLPSHSLNIHPSLSGTYCCSLASHRCPIRSSRSLLFFYTQICSLLFLKPLSCRAVYCPHKHDHNWCRTTWNILHTQPLQNVLIMPSIEETWLTMDFKRKVLTCC